MKKWTIWKSFHLTPSTRSGTGRILYLVKVDTALPGKILMPLGGKRSAKAEATAEDAPAAESGFPQARARAAARAKLAGVALALPEMQRCLLCATSWTPSSSDCGIY